MIKNQWLIGNCAELIVVSSDDGNPLRGKIQNSLSVIQKGCLVVENGFIKDFGYENKIGPLYKDYPYFDAQNRILLPAFVDPHTHIVFAGTREEEFLGRLKGESYLEILEKGYGIFSTVKATEESSEEELYQLALDRIQRFQRQGTVGLEIKSGYGLDLKTEKKMLSVIRRLKHELPIPIRSTFLAAHALPKEFERNREKYIEQVCGEMIPDITAENLADFIDVFCEKGVFSAEESKRILAKGKEYGLGVKIHTDEFASIGGLMIANELNALSADHMIVSQDKELDLLSKGETIAVILPGTSFAIKEVNYDYGRRIIDKNIPLAIGTDYNPGTCMCSSMQMMMELSVLKFSLSIEEAINACTINASFACGLSQETGSIERGKRADLALYDVDTYKKLPYQWGINKLKSLFVKGIPVVFA